jgi:signal transduction histidine kinase
VARESDIQDRLRSRSRLVAGTRWLAGAGTVALATAFPSLALADETMMIGAGGMAMGVREVIQLAVFLGVTGAAIFSALWLIRERGRTAAENVKLRTRVGDLTNALRRAEALLNLKDQRFIVWSDEARKPEIIGALPASFGVPDDRSTLLAFGKWLTPRSAATMEQAVAGLRETAATFDLVLETQKGVLLEAQGRSAASHVAVRLLSFSSARREHAELRLDYERVSAEHDSLLSLARAIEMPMWLRGPDQRLAWVNPAYAAAVEAESPKAAIEEDRQFLGTSARQAIANHHLAEPVFARRVSTVVGGDRKIFAVTDVAGPGGSAGIASDVTEIESVRAEYERTLQNHADTLDQLNTAVAIFDEKQKLRFFNQAFQKLWDLDPVFLESAPDHALLLDRLRSDGKLAEQPEWRRWKENLLSAYRAVEPQEHWWHLPDGRTLRVVANPQPKGGVTWVFENLTEKIDLESRYNTAVRVQGETLDNLAEGVAVFGADGRLRLVNPAFSSLWRLPAGVVETGTHISVIRAACAVVAENSPWSELVATVTGFDDERRNSHGQTELIDGTVLRYAIIHLPNGQVMTTFVDVTDSVNVERALKDKNEALEMADRLKNDFVQHVSYELRSPLTNIIGFTELLALPETGPLTERQKEYVEHIGSSSSVLLTIVNDILDLATVDAGIMELEIVDVRIADTIHSAADLISERLKEFGIRLELDIAEAPESFQADEHRVRQILFNLLSNAANYAPENGSVRLSCRGAGNAIEFSVHDDGPGMSEEVLETIFRRFEPRPNGGRRRGAGLGLSIVKSFVELHGGNVRIDTDPESGTTVTCRFPLVPEGLAQAAE